MSVYLLAPILALMATFASFGFGAFVAVFTEDRLAHLLAGLAAMLACTILTTWLIAKVAA